MPMWNIAHPPGAFTQDQKHSFANEITQLYVELGLPRFYVNVFFWEMQKENLYIGGEPTDDFVRIWIDHIALDTIDSDIPMEITRAWVGQRLNACVTPFVKDRGYRWEMHVDDTPFPLWTVDGIFPPRPYSALHQKWTSDNKPSEFDYESEGNIPLAENMPKLGN